MQYKTKSKRKFHSWLLSLRSPIRWGFLGLGIAVSFFLAGISLSLLQIFLFLLGGDLMVESWVQIVVATMSIFIFLLCLALIGLTVYAGILWYRNRDVDDTARIIRKTQKDVGEIKQRLKHLNGGVK